ncbi:MAG: hydantoinase B/oxoprolinase family protein, partial [Actinomycetia bacterium]|nr:hydantoinase B/oxoprolinase family protein [Actinomycetes bacterium]
GGDPIELRATVVIEGSNVLFDFTGHEPQRAGACGNINFVCLQAMCRVALKCLIAPRIPANHGMYRPVAVVATPGTVTNPQHPAPCTTWGDMGSGVQEAVFAALAPVLPDRVSAGIFGYGQTMAIAGPRPVTGEEYIHFMPYAGGWGGRSAKDGLSALCPLLNGDNYNMPCEVTEAEYPLRVERYELIRDSAGPGKFRGGLGMRTDYRVLGERVEVSAAFNRYTTPPPGLFGGGSASLNALILDLRGSSEANCPSVSGGVVLGGAVISHRTAGGGGFGDPRERDPDLVRADLADGYISPEAASRDYGLEIDPAEARRR